MSVDELDPMTPFERASRELRAEVYAPEGAYAQGWRDAIDATMRCGAYNAAVHDGQGTFALCVKAVEHTGMHDDTWRRWGDRLATPDQTRQDAVESTRAARRAWVVAQERARRERTRAVVQRLAAQARGEVAQGPSDIPPGIPQGA